jgi:hypothetical protein
MKTKNAKAIIFKSCSVVGCCQSHLARGYCQTHYMQLRRAGSPLVSPIPKETPQQYILARVLVDADGCWIWQQSKYQGYGKTGVGGTANQAHRFSWEAFNGPIPDGYQVNHKCHKRDCVNPACLYVGDQVENMRDMYQAGRQSVRNGEKNGMSKLDNEKVLFILRSSLSARKLRGLLGVSDTLIRAIRERKIWRHVNA